MSIERTRRPVLLAVAVGVLVAACVDTTPATSTVSAPPSTAASSVPEDPTRPTYVRDTPLPEEIVERNTPDPSPEAEEAFYACLEDAGYTREDWARFYGLNGDGSTSGTRDNPERSAFNEVKDICITESGVGYVAGFDPEYVAAVNESLLIEAQCMQDLGWSDFPDPVPGEGDLLESGLGPDSGFEPPTGPEEKERYESDREYCGTQSGIPYFRE